MSVTTHQGQCQSVPFPQLFMLNLKLGHWCIKKRTSVFPRVEICNTWCQLDLTVCIYVCDSGVSSCSGVVFLVVPCFRCDLNVSASYTHTVSMPSPAVCSGTQVGKGKRQATTLAVLGNSLASFSSSWFICRYRQHQSAVILEVLWPNKGCEQLIIFDSIYYSCLQWTEWCHFSSRTDNFITDTCIYCLSTELILSASQRAGQPECRASAWSAL